MKARCLALIVLAAGVPALARDYQTGALRIVHPWTRPAAAGQNGAGYVDITNLGRAPDALRSVKSAEVVEASLHQTMTHDGRLMTMPVTGSLIIPAGETVRLSPGGYHIMFTGLRAASRTGGTLPVTLTFARAGDVKVIFAVEAGTETSGKQP